MNIGSEIKVKVLDAVTEHHCRMARYIDRRKARHYSMNWKTDPWYIDPDCPFSFSTRVRSQFVRGQQSALDDVLYVDASESLYTIPMSIPLVHP